MLAALSPLRAVLHERLDALYATLPAATPSAERPALYAALDERRRTLEIAEEHAIVEAELAGIVIARRPDADPAVVLCVVLAADA